MGNSEGPSSPQVQMPALLHLCKRLERCWVLTDILDAVAPTVDEVLGYPHAWLAVFGQTPGLVSVISHAANDGQSEEILKKSQSIEIPIAGDPFLAEILAADHVVVVEDARTDPRTNKDVVAFLNNRTIINVPLILAGQSMGTLGLGTFGDVEGVRPPQAWHLTFLEAVAGHVAVALDRVKFLEQKQRDQDLLYREKERLQVTLESIGDAVIATDQEGLVTDLNPTAARLTGWSKSEALGQPLARVFSIFNRLTGNPVENPVQKVMATGQVVGLANHTVLKSRSGQDYQISDSASPIRDRDQGILGVVLVFRDVTEQYTAEAEKRALERELLQSQKMESLGFLAGGVAHDMNNLLAAISAVTAVQLQRLEPGSSLGQSFATIRRAIDRGAAMTSNLLKYARKGPTASQPVDWNDLVREQLDLVQTAAFSKVELRKDLWPAPLVVQGDSGALGQALMNLCVNGFDAFDEVQNEKMVTVTTRLQDDWIEVEVADNGQGMSEEVLQRAMEPFYTTKDSGRGTGLGLSMVNRIVQAHSGQVLMESTPGRGTRVLMRFPSAAGQPAREREASPTKSPAARVAKRVLLVDDDDLVRGPTSELLTLLGTETTAVDRAERALERLEAGDEYDLVILDVNMPGMGGFAAVAAIRRLQPRLPIVLTTGYPDPMVIEAVETVPFTSLLVKPFDWESLRQTLL